MSRHYREGLLLLAAGLLLTLVMAALTPHPEPKNGDPFAIITRKN